MRYATALLSLFVGEAVWASDCDCQQIVGSCLGSIEFVKAYGSKPSFGADLIVHSSVKTCSKVEFMVNSTPYQTILANKNAEPESIFGTSPISAKNVTFQTCNVCASVGTTGQAAAGAAPQVPSYDLTGRWSSNQVCSYGSGQSEMNVVHNQSSGSITGKLSNSTIDTGTIQGNIVHITASNWMGNKVVMQGRVTDPTHMSGTYTQSSRSGTCTWDATKR